MSTFDLAVLQRSAPRNVAKNITQETIDNLNSLSLDPDFAETYRDNIIGYMSVLRDGRFKMEDYFHAVRYCSYKLMGDNNITAYTKTFPDKYARWVMLNVPDKQIHAYSTAYSKNKLVNLIMEQSVVPFYVYNQEARQKALMVQMELMVSARSEKVRSDAANSVLTHTKAPENIQVQMDIGIKDDTGAIHELRMATQELLRMQKEKIIDGSVSVEQVAGGSLYKPVKEEDDGDY